MIYLIFVGIGIILLLLSYRTKVKEEDTCMCSITISLWTIAWSLLLLGIIGSFATISSGIQETQDIIAQKEYVLSLKNEIQNVKDATYGNSGFDLRDFKQSTALSKYLSEYAKAKADYNAMLVKLKFHKTNWLYKWFLEGAFISSKILQFKPL